MSRNKCVNKADNFCYACGEVTFTKQKRNISASVKNAYRLYFGFDIGHQDKKWAPHRTCLTCSSTLLKWMKGERKSMPFVVPMLWREPSNHLTDCYFCMMPPLRNGYTKKKKWTIKYPNLPSATRPVPHSKNSPVPKPVASCSFGAIDQDETDLLGTDRDSFQDSNFTLTPEQPHRITQAELNDLVRDLDLPKSKAELLGSRLKQWHLLEKDVNTSIYRNRHKDLVEFFAMEDNLVFCSDVDNLMKALGIEHNPTEWRLFIDSSKLSLKAVLLHNGNILPSIPIAYAAHMKETYSNMKKILTGVNYDEHQWHICGDLKVVAILLGLQLGYTKFCCFLCEWDSRARTLHYKKKNWLPRKSFVPGSKNVQNLPLIDPNKVFLPSLHIKLGLIKNFVKAIDQTGRAFQYLRNKFPQISDAKIKEGIFVGPQIRKILYDEEFESLLTEKEKVAWKSFQLVVSNFLGNTKSDNYKTLVQNLLLSYERLGCNMSLKLHFLHSHLDFFPINCGAVSDEHGERFHQDIAAMEKRYQGKWTASMLADYCWTLVRDSPEATYKRHAKKSTTN